MKTFFSTLILSFAITFVFGHSFSQNNKIDDTLLNVKSLVEKHFSGTTYRGIYKDFKIDDSLSSSYHLYGGSTNFITPVNLEKLNSKLEKLLKNRRGVKLIGTIYFDFFLDSVIVDLDYRKDDTVYKFIAMSGTPVPIKGYSAFSKRMHDFLKELLANHKLTKDSIQFIGTAKFIAEAKGTIFAAKQGYLTDALDNFLKIENRWTPGMHSGPLVNTKVSFALDKSYLFKENTNWPSEYGEGQMSFENLASFSTRENEIFYSNNLPKYGEKTIVSVVYDSMLKRYRLPYVHVDNQGKAKKLIELIINNKRIYGEDMYEFSRKYYYIYSDN